MDGVTFQRCFILAAAVLGRIGESTHAGRHGRHDWYSRRGALFFNSQS